VKIIDLSVAVEDSPSEPIRPQIADDRHDDTAPLVAGLFGVLWTGAADAVVDGS
jgi:hypothetical protein